MGAGVQHFIPSQESPEFETSSYLQKLSAAGTCLPEHKSQSVAVDNLKQPQESNSTPGIKRKTYFQNISMVLKKQNFSLQICAYFLVAVTVSVSAYVYQ